MKVTYYYIVNVHTGLIARCVSHRSAVKVAVLIGGVVINARCPQARDIINTYRQLWNSI